MSRKRAIQIGVVVALVLLLGAVSIVPPLMDNPFLVARAAIVETGGWSDEDVVFRRGSYGFWPLPLTCRVRAVAWVQDGDQRREAEVEMVHLPLLGWTIESFRLGAPL